MRLPAPSAHFSHIVRYGNYVARRLRRARMLPLAADVEKTTALVLLTGRALEDVSGGETDERSEAELFEKGTSRRRADGRAEDAGPREARLPPSRWP